MSKFFYTPDDILTLDTMAEQAEVCVQLNIKYVISETLFPAYFFTSTEKLKQWQKCMDSKWANKSY